MSVGIDTSTKSLAIGIIDENEEVEYHIYYLTQSNFFDKLLEMYEATSHFVKTVKGREEPFEICIEEPIYVNSSIVYMKLSMICAAVILGCMDNGILPEGVNNTTWKKCAIGNGHAKKEDIKSWVVERLGVDDELEQDIYDALGVAVYRKDWMKVI